MILMKFGVYCPRTIVKIVEKTYSENMTGTAGSD
jgi:hypothetical protein